MNLNSEVLKKIMQKVADTRPDEIDCGDCFEQLDRFAELVLSGKPIQDAMPLVQDHLKRCDDCREEFETLLSVLTSMNQ
jgi:hypothetical protein